MKKGLLIFVLFLLIKHSSYAQHCPWDGTSFVMLTFPNSADKIHHIYLEDSTGKKVISRWYSGPDSVRIDTAQFWRNSDADPKARSLQKRMYHFPFAGDHYVLSFGQANRQMNYKIRVTLHDGTRVSYVLASKDIHALCTSNKDLWNGNVKPVQLNL